MHLYHSAIAQVLDQARKADDLRAYHFALLRQVLENVASFLGKGQFGYVLEQIGIDNPNDSRGHHQHAFAQEGLLLRVRSLGA